MSDGKDPELSQVFKDILWGEPRGAFDKPLGQSLLKVYGHSAGNEFTDKLVHGLVHPLRVQELFGNLPPFFKPRFSGGEIVVQDLYGQRVRFPLAALGKHGLNVASTGAGKTCWTMNLGLQLAFWKIIPWFIEFIKRQFRQLVPLFAILGLQLVVLQGRRSNSIRFRPDSVICAHT